MLIYWIKQSAQITKKILRENLEKVENIELLEVDELYTYIKKNLLTTQKTKLNTHLFGLLSTETETKLLILK